MEAYGSFLIQDLKDWRFGKGSLLICDLEEWQRSKHPNVKNFFFDAKE